MLSGTRSALAPCRSGPALSPDTGEGALPADTRFVPAPQLDFLAAHRIGQVGLYLGGKVSKRLPDLRVGFRAGAPKPKRGLPHRVEEWVTPQRPASPSRPPSL